jgi:hypothetical protein
MEEREGKKEGEREREKEREVERRTNDGRNGKKSPSLSSSSSLPSPDSWYLMGNPRQVQLFDAKGLAPAGGGPPLWSSAEAASAAVATEEAEVEIFFVDVVVGGREATTRVRSGASAETPALLEALLFGAATGQLRLETTALTTRILKGEGER